jgi:hypothetical protein
VDLTPEDIAKRSSLPYPMDLGSPKFELVDVTQQKDLMLNAARMFAQQEYDRIMDLVKVLQSQADGIKRRLEITDAVHAAEYSFKLYPGGVYWLAMDTRKSKTILTILGPNDWSTAAPKEYEYIACVKWLGDHTWIEVQT